MTTLCLSEISLNQSLQYSTSPKDTFISMEPCSKCLTSNLEINWSFEKDLLCCRFQVAAIRCKHFTRHHSAPVPWTSMAAAFHELGPPPIPRSNVLFFSARSNVPDFYSTWCFFYLSFCSHTVYIKITKRCQTHCMANALMPHDPYWVIMWSVRFCWFDVKYSAACIAVFPVKFGRISSTEDICHQRHLVTLPGSTAPYTLGVDEGVPGGRPHWCSLLWCPNDISEDNLMRKKAFLHKNRTPFWLQFPMVSHCTKYTYLCPLMFKIILIRNLIQENNSYFFSSV